MWLILPAFSLAIVHIAGDNVGVVPDMAAVLGNGIYGTVIVAYIILGSAIAGLSAWIGVRCGQELVGVANRLFGYTGKRILAVAILTISLPASSLTGGYFGGTILQFLTGTPYGVSVALNLALCSVLAAGYWQELLKISNCISILLLPLIALIFVMQESGLKTAAVEIGNVDWLLVLALVSYNAGGMRLPLVVETAVCLARRGYKAVYIAVAAKMVEGILTLSVAHLVLSSGYDGPLALSGAAGQVFGLPGLYIFNFVLFCTLMNAMAPAMLVNAKQIGSITGLAFWPSLLTAVAMVILGSFLDINKLLGLMSGTGLLMMSFIVYTAYFLHKCKVKQP